MTKENASMNETTEKITYSDTGVDTAEGARAVDAIRESVRSTYRPEVIGDIGGFGGLFSAAAFKDMQDPVMVSGTDGVGTKLKLAQRFDRHDTVGIDLVAMCVNDILVAGAEPLFFLDYMAVGKLESDRAKDIVAGVAEGCRQAGCALVGGEMAEHPGVMDDDDYDLAGFGVGVVDRPKMITGEDVAPGDVILGLGSSGFHSNGFSLVRRVLVDNATDEELLAPREDLDGRSLVDALLEPTRIYVKPILEVLKKGASVKAMAHITGGGITENLDRVLPKNCDASIEIGSWDMPRVIVSAVKAASLSRDEAFKTFNMGLGFAIICSPDEAESIGKALIAQGETVFHIGQVVAGTGTVTYR